MKIFIFILAAVISTAILAGSEGGINSYQQRIADRRNGEAKILWSEMEAEGFTETTNAALDFVFFSDVKADAENLAKALSQNYTATVSAAVQDGYWLVTGTTRPYGRQFTAGQWFGWVEYMVVLGFSNNSVLSTYSVYEPKSKRNWSSESVEVDE